jgi:hypothetical protein
MYIGFLKLGKLKYIQLTHVLLRLNSALKTSYGITRYFRENLSKQKAKHYSPRAKDVSILPGIRIFAT